MNHNVIEVKNLSKKYIVREKQKGFIGSLKSIFSNKTKEVNAVSDISFDIKEGELVGFIGPNGAGKTTTLKMLSGILYPTSGEISILGYKPFDRKNDFLKQISLVMGQKNQLLWDLPPIDTFYLNKETYEIPNAQFKETYEDLINIFEIKDIINKQTRRLSLGERMKCEVVAALLHKPKILFLDEPTIGMDVIMQKKMRYCIKEFNKKYNTSVILTSHYMDDVKEICNKVIIINKGNLVYNDSIEHLFDNYIENKSIEVIINKPIDIDTLKDIFTIKEYVYPKLLIECQRNKLADTLTKIIKSVDVDDINIMEPKLEDIVQDIFQK